MPLHDRGQVMVDLAVAIILGARCIRDIRLLEHQRPVFGPVASHPTAWRALKELDELARTRADRSRATVRRRVYELLRERPEGFPEVEVEGVPLTGWTVIDSDGTLIPAPSEKEGAHGTYKGFLGHHVFVATCDNTGEQLAARLYAGNVTANDAAVNIDILTRAVAQLPWWRRQKILFRVDGAGFSHQLIDWIASTGGRKSPTFRWEYSVGWAFTTREQAAIEICRDQKASGIGLLPSRELEVNGLVHRHHPRRRSPLLVPAPRAGRRARQGHPEDPALPHPPRSRTPRARPAKTTSQTPLHLALGHGDHPRLRTDPRPAPPHLTSTNDLIEYREEAHPHAPGPWNPASSGTSADAHP
ncbi:transposase [Streptomyces brevispora]